MNDAQFFVKIEDRLGELPKYNRGFIFLEERIFASVFKEIALSKQLSHDVNLS